MEAEQPEISNKDTVRWINGFRSSDDSIIGEFWAAHEHRLKRVAKKYLSIPLARRVDEDDVAQSAFRTFLRRMNEGQFSFDSRDDITHLLFAITANKVREKARYHLRKKRGVDQEVYLSHLTNLKRAEPTPDESVVFREVLDMIAELDEEDQTLIEMRLNQATQEEIAIALQCSERSVRRKLTKLQTRLESMIAQ